VYGDQLVFEPHGLARAFTAEVWSVGLGEIDSVTVGARRPFSHFLAGGLRQQLCVEAQDQRAYFVVWNSPDFAES